MTGKHEAALRLLLRREASDWAYGVGLPRYQADAFGEWFVEKYGIDPRWRPDWSTAKTTFDHDPRARELVAKYGAQPETLGSATPLVCVRCHRTLVDEGTGRFRDTENGQLWCKDDNGNEDLHTPHLPE